MDAKLMAQYCMECKRQLQDGDHVIVKMYGRFEQFTVSMHRVEPYNETEEIVHEQCDED